MHINLSGSVSSKTIQKNPLLEKSKIACPFILRRNRRAKEDNCDFSHSNVDDTTKKYQSTTLPKHMVFCSFLQKKDYGKTGQRCDFCHNITYQTTIKHQFHLTSPRQPVELYQQHKVAHTYQNQLPYQKYF